MDNIYECATCGGCVNVCVTGWDPVMFTKETRLHAALEGKLPPYIQTLLDNCLETGNAYGKTALCDGLTAAIKKHEKKTDTLLFLGVDARYMVCEQAKKAIEVLESAGVDFTALADEPASGAQLDFLIGAANETKEQMTAAAKVLDTFKTVVVAAALEEGVVSENDTFYCSGSYKVAGYDKPIGCSKRTGHGMQTLAQAVQNSCNPAFIQIGQRLGLEKFYNYFEAFGMTEQTGIDLPGEASGVFHTRERLANTASYGTSYLIATSFGQTIKPTPIQLVTAISAVVNGGYLLEPYAVSEIVDSEGNVVQQNARTVVRQVISEETSATMRQIIESVVTEGTAKNGSVVGYRIGGKTGTAEKTDQTDSNGQQTNDKIVSFVGIAPMDDPEYVVLIALDTPNPATGTYISGGVMAAPTVARVMEDILPYLGVEPDYSEVDMSRVTVRMPNLAGKTESEAAAILEEDHLNYKIIGDGDKIVSQIPAHGRELPGNSTVLLYTDDSMPTDEVEVPNLTGMTVAQASTTLSQLGLYLQAKGTDSNAWYVVVTKQDIDAGTKVPRGTMIAVTFTDTTALD